MAGRKELENLALSPWATCRRQKLLKIEDWLEAPLRVLDEAVIQEAALPLGAQWNSGEWVQ